MARALLGPRLFLPGPRRLVELGADDRDDLLLAAFLVEWEGAEHVSVIGEGKPLHAQVFCPGHQGLDRAGAVQEGEIRMAVKMHERCHAAFIPSL